MFSPDSFAHWLVASWNSMSGTEMEKDSSAKSIMVFASCSSEPRGNLIGVKFHLTGRRIVRKLTAKVALAVVF